jgi:thiol-disulfide isomerase/thioredoxin
MSKTTLQTIGLLIGLACIVVAAPLLWKIDALDQSRAGLQIGQAIPPITDVEGWLNGDGPTPDELQGKVVFVNGWFLNCPYCHKGMPDLVKIYDEYHSKGVVFVGMTSDDSVSVKNVEKFLDKYKVEWPNAYGAANSLMAFEADYFPGYWLIGRDGKVVWNKALQGRVPIQTAIEQALAAKAPAPSTTNVEQPSSSTSTATEEQRATAQL